MGRQAHASAQWADCGPDLNDSDLQGPPALWDWFIHALGVYAKNHTQFCGED